MHFDLQVVNLRCQVCKGFGLNNSMIDSIKILAEMTKRDVERNLSLDKKTLENVNADYSPRYGWHLKRKEVPSVSKDNKLLDI